MPILCPVCGAPMYADEGKKKRSAANSADVLFLSVREKLRKTQLKHGGISADTANGGTAWA